MFDFMEGCLFNFYKLTDWKLDSSYANLTSTSRTVLEFQPCSLPFKFILGKSITPYLKSTYALTLPPLHHFSFLTSSIGLEKLERRADDDFYLFILDKLKDKENENREISLFQKNYLLHGRLYQDFRLEGLLAYRYHPSMQFIVSTVSAIKPSLSHLNIQWQYHLPHMSNEVSFSSHLSLLGWKGLYFLQPDSDRWAVGGEFYFTGEEKSGGLSIGGRLRDSSFVEIINEHQEIEKRKTISDFTLIMNPIMGHLSFSYATSIPTPYQSEWLWAAKYDFNVNSFDSDASLGFIYAPRERNQLLKFRFGFLQGIGVIWESHFNNFMVSIGASAEFQNYQQRNLFGIEVQYSSE